MQDAESIRHALRRDEGLYAQLLELVSSESRKLRSEDEYSRFEYYQARRQLLPELEQSLEKLRVLRLAWTRLDLSERARYPDIAASLRSNQDTVMKILMLDRDNEQWLLRRGLVPPRSLPPAQRQQPGFVAGLYRRNTPVPSPS